METVCQEWEFHDEANARSFCGTLTFTVKQTVGAVHESGAREMLCDTELVGIEGFITRWTGSEFDAETPVADIKEAPQWLLDEALKVEAES